MEGGSGLSVKDRIKMFQKPQEENKAVPKAEVSTGVSIKDRQAQFVNKPQPVNQFVPSSAQPKTEVKPQVQAKVEVKPQVQPSPAVAVSPVVAKSEPEKQDPPAGLSVKERMALLQQGNKAAQEKKEPVFRPSVDSSGNSLQQRISATFSPFSMAAPPVNSAPAGNSPPVNYSAPVTSSQNKFTSSTTTASYAPSTVSEPVRASESEKTPISTGLSIKERMAALQQSSKTTVEKPAPASFMPSGRPSIAERINLVQDAQVQSSIHRAKTEEVGGGGDVRGISSRFENSGNEAPKHTNSVVTGRISGVDSDFKKRMEGMVFMPPPPGGFVAKPRAREEEDFKSDNPDVLVELNKPVRKRAAPTFTDDFDF